MSDNPAIVVFTFKSVEHLIRDGGTRAWRLDRSHARMKKYVVCTRNSYHEEVEGNEEHGSAFLVGKISDVLPAPGHTDRYIIKFDEFAPLNVPDAWKGERNPVRYSTLERLGIDPTSLTWERIPEPGENEQQSERVELPPIPGPSTIGLSLAEAKKGLALTFGVAPEAIEITIRG